MTQRSRLRGQDGFIREAIWIVVILTIIAVAILDGMAIFSAYQSAGDSATNAADAGAHRVRPVRQRPGREARRRRSTSPKKGLEMVGFKAVQATDGTVQFTVTAKATADTYAFRLLGAIPQLKDWVERTTHPTRTGNAE